MRVRVMRLPQILRIIGLLQQQFRVRTCFSKARSFSSPQTLGVLLLKKIRGGVRARELGELTKNYHAGAIRCSSSGPSSSLLKSLHIKAIKNQHKLSQQKGN